MHPDSGISNSTPSAGSLILSRENNSSPRIFPTMSQVYSANVYEPVLSPDLPHSVKKNIVYLMPF